MELYGQDADAQILCALLQRLPSRAVIDVGAERGDFASVLLNGGADRVYLLEPHPRNASGLRERFARDPRTTIYECAIGDRDGTAELHESVDAMGEALPFGHTLLSLSPTDEIAWPSTTTVRLRSLGSLLANGELPRRAGVLKVDTEGNDLGVVRGMGALDVDVVMVEHWTDLPHGLGACPWTSEEMLAELQPRGFGNFAFVVHRGEFVTLKWNDAEVERGAMGNLVFLHDRVLPQLAPVVLDLASRLAEQAVAVGQMYMRAAQEREQVIEELKDAADARLLALEEVSARLAAVGAGVAAPVKGAPEDR